MILAFSLLVELGTLGDLLYCFLAPEGAGQCLQYPEECERGSHIHRSSFNRIVGALA